MKVCCGHIEKQDTSLSKIGLDVKTDDATHTHQECMKSFIPYIQGFLGKPGQASETCPKMA